MSAGSSASSVSRGRWPWTAFEPSSACFTAVPSRTRSVGSTPCMTRSPAATCCGGRGATCAPTEGAPGRRWRHHRRVEDSGVREFLEELAAELQGRYVPAAAAAAGAYPQAGQAGSDAAAGHPTVRDRVVMAAAKIVLEPVFEADFLAASFGFRPEALGPSWRSRRFGSTANRGGRLGARRRHHSCFDEIDHDALDGSDRPAGV